MGKENVSFATNDNDIAEAVQDWSEGQSMYVPPKCAEDLRIGERDTVVSWVEQIHTNQLARQVFTAEMQQEEVDETHDSEETLDRIDDDERIKRIFLSSCLLVFLSQSRQVGMYHSYNRS